MNKRPLLLGLGLGILFSATILRFGSESSLNVPAPQELAPAPLEKQQVEQWLQQNGYALVTQSEWETQLEKVKKLQEAPPAPQTTSVYMNPGISVVGMENILVKSGLLPQNNQFAEILSKQGLSRQIRSGLYTFTGKQTEESIIAEITKPR